MKWLSRFNPGFASGRKICEAIADFLSFGGAVATFLGIGSSFGSNSSGPFFTMKDAPFALRTVLLVFVAAALGWTLGSLTSRLTQTRKEQWHIVSYILAVIMGATLITVAELLADRSASSDLPQVPLFSLVGACLIIAICRFVFRTRLSSIGASLHSRSICLVAFSATSLIVLILLGLN